MWLEETIEIRVVIEEKQLMYSNQPWNDVQSHNFHFKPFVHTLDVLEKLLGKGLKVKLN